MGTESVPVRGTTMGLATKEPTATAREAVRPCQIRKAPDEGGAGVRASGRVHDLRMSREQAVA